MPDLSAEIASPIAHHVRNAVAAGLLARGRHRGFVNGQVEPVADGRDLPLTDPATGASIGAVATADRELIDRAVRAARVALDGPWGALSPLRRGRILMRLGELIEEHAEALIELEVVCTGKPRREAESFDIPQSAEHFLYYGGWPGKLGGETFTVPHEDALVYTLRQPIGVVAAIVPWNFPLLLASWKLAPALAAGCTAVLKPSEQTPLTALQLAELAAEAGLPPGVLNVICGDARAGADLVDHPGIDKVAFTGSTAVGREIIHASAEAITPLSLELGGNAPLVVFSDSDLDAAAATVVAGSFYNAGQVCVSAARLYVESDGFDELVAEVARRADALAIGPGLDPATQLGPLASRRHAARVAAYVDGIAAEGGELRTRRAPPQGLPADGFYSAPAVVVGLDDAATATREEVFGPLLVAQPFDDLDEVARRANATPYGLAAGIFSADLARAHRLAARIRAGTVWINTYQVSDSAVPAGGVKHSGYGRDRGRRALEGFLEERVVWADLRAPNGETHESALPGE